MWGVECIIYLCVTFIFTIYPVLVGASSKNINAQQNSFYVLVYVKKLAVNINTIEKVPNQEMQKCTCPKMYFQSTSLLKKLPVKFKQSGHMTEALTSVTNPLIIANKS